MLKIIFKLKNIWAVLMNSPFVLIKYLKILQNYLKILLNDV